MLLDEPMRSRFIIASIMILGGILLVTLSQLFITKQE